MAAEIPAEPGIREAKTHFTDYVNRVIYRDDMVWITKNKRRVAALIPAEIGEWIEANADAVAEAVRLHQAARDAASGGSLPGST